MFLMQLMEKRKARVRDTSKREFSTASLYLSSFIIFLKKKKNVFKKKKEAE